MKVSFARGGKFEQVGFRGDGDGGSFWGCRGGREDTKWI